MINEVIPLSLAPKDPSPYPPGKDTAHEVANYFDIHPIRLERGRCHGEMRLPIFGNSLSPQGYAILKAVSVGVRPDPIYQRIHPCSFSNL